jgi:hypothetical protein
MHFKDYRSIAQEPLAGMSRYERSKEIEAAEGLPEMRGEGFWVQASR